MDAVVTIIKWAIVVGLITAFVAALAGTFAGMGLVGTEAFYDLQAGARGPVLSPNSSDGLITEIMAATFGYDRYGTQTYLGVIPLLFGFVTAMGSLYMLYWGVRLFRAVFS